MQFDALLSEFIALGGEGIEVVTGSHTLDQFDEYAALARRTGLLVWPTRRPYHDLRPFRDSENAAPCSCQSA
jgi:uncharacterized NAD-dependent epimerase/dehydratase family protein